MVAAFPGGDLLTKNSVHLIAFDWGDDVDIKSDGSMEFSIPKAGGRSVVICRMISDHGEKSIREVPLLESFSNCHLHRSTRSSTDSRLSWLTSEGISRGECMSSWLESS